VSAAPSERSIAVWNTSGSKKAKKLGGVAVASLEVDQPAVSVCTCSALGADADGSFYTAAVTEGGEAFVWLCAPEGEAAVVGALAARVRVSGGSGSSGDGILSATLEAADDGRYRLPPF
jgi:U3 small nucleolar RNA-associated protein 5